MLYSEILCQILTKREELSLIRVLALPKAVNKNRKMNTMKVWNHQLSCKFRNMFVTHE